MRRCSSFLSLSLSLTLSHSLSLTHSLSLSLSQSLEVLSVLEEVLKLAPSPRRLLKEAHGSSTLADNGAAAAAEGGGGADRANAGWQRGLDYMRFDGTCDADERDVMIQVRDEIASECL